MVFDNYNMNAVFVGGNTGEGIVQCILEQSNLTFYHDIFLEDSNGKVTQVDFLVLTNNSIVCIEVKNYNKCVIKGDDDSRIWTACYRSGNRNFLNPINQNDIHVKACHDIFGDDINIYSIIVFPNSCCLRVSCNDLHTSITNITDMWYKLLDIQSYTFKQFNKEKRDYIINTLDKFYKNSVELFDKHQRQHFKK